jgi:hypothetical protein
VVHTNPCLLWRQEDHEFKASLGKVSEALSQTQNKKERTGGIAQGVEHLPSMHKALDSMPLTSQKCSC